MTTLTGRTTNALIVVDVQNDVVANAFRRDDVVANIAQLVERARAQGIPVIWVQHCDDDLEYGSDGWQIVPELTPVDGEPLVHKRFGDAFEATALADILGELRVGRLVVVGAQTDACVRSTMHGSFTRGYDVTLVSDAHTTDDRSQYGVPPPDQVIAHTNMYWSYQRAPGRIAEVVDTAAVLFAC
jgi:nicotinamidase-related amidase